MIEEIRRGALLLAIIVRSSYNKEGISFFTEDHMSQQLAYMRHPTGHRIKPHVHNAVAREVHYTKEVLILKRGRMRVDFYDETQEYLFSRDLSSGDVLLLANGGHGFEILEEVEMFEVKQGPYSGEADKTRFEGISAAQVTYSTTAPSS